MLDEVIDVVAAIDETAFLPVDEADVRRRYDDVFETATASGTHALPSPKGVMKPVCFYHTPGHASRHLRARAGVLRRASDQRASRARGPRRPGAQRLPDRRRPLRVRPGPLRRAGPPGHAGAPGRGGGRGPRPPRPRRPRRARAPSRGAPGAAGGGGPAPPGPGGRGGAGPTARGEEPRDTG